MGPVIWVETWRIRVTKPERIEENQRSLDLTYNILRHIVETRKHTQRQTARSQTNTDDTLDS